MHVKVVDYNGEWERLYEAEAAAIGEILGGLVEIHHIEGCTESEGQAYRYLYRL